MFKKYNTPWNYTYLKINQISFSVSYLKININDKIDNIYDKRVYYIIFMDVRVSNNRI